MDNNIGANKMSLLHPEYDREIKQSFQNIISKSYEFRKNGFPKTLYHYTSSFETLKGIVSNREIWATNISFLNDVAELDYIKILAEEPSLDGLVKEYLKNWQPISADFLTQNYVMSFSEKKDYLPLWSTFTKMQGYCIGFDTVETQNAILSKQILNIEVLRVYNESSNVLAKKYEPDIELSGAAGGDWHLYPVIYDKSVQINILNTVIKQTIKRCLEISKTADSETGQSVIITTSSSGERKEIGRINKDEVALNNAIDRTLNLCATIFKSGDFSYEHEWRLVKEMNANNRHLLRSQIFTRELDRAIIPFIKMGLRNNLSFPIVEVITGPLSNSDTVIPGLEFTFFDAGYKTLEDGVLIEKSKIKLRRF